MQLKVLHRRLMLTASDYSDRAEALESEREAQTASNAGGEPPRAPSSPSNSWSSGETAPVPQDSPTQDGGDSR